MQVGFARMRDIVEVHVNHEHHADNSSFCHDPTADELCKMFTFGHVQKGSHNYGKRMETVCAHDKTAG